MGQHIFDLSKLEFEDIPRLQHIPVCILVENHDILVSMSMLQILVLKYDSGYWNHMERDHKHYLLGPLLVDNLV